VREPKAPLMRLLRDTSIRLRDPPDEAILRLARALARQAAREDYSREAAQKGAPDDARRGLCAVLDRPAERAVD
jgi:hypothetical protein